jgi:hypothetical protein
MGRVFARCSVVLKVLEGKCAGAAIGTPCYGHTTDFSMYGARLVMGTEYQVNSQVELILVLTNPAATFRHVGVIRWCRRSTADQKFFVGVEFTASSPKTTQAWAKFVSSRF